MVILFENGERRCVLTCQLNCTNPAQKRSQPGYLRRKARKITKDFKHSILARVACLAGVLPRAIEAKTTQNLARESTIQHVSGSSLTPHAVVVQLKA